jgi:hypothetical protein
MRRSLMSTLVLPCSLACATVTGVLQQPVPDGRGQRYTVPADSVVAAAVRAFGASGLRMVRDTMVGPTRLLVAKVGMTPLSWGEFDRAAITPLGDTTEVRIVSRPINQLDFLHRNRSPRLFQALDRELGGIGIGPFAGDRVRIITSGSERKTLTGRMLAPRDSAGVLSIEVDGRDKAISATDVARMSISRGSYGHPKEGGLLGFLVGGVTGIAIVGGGSSSEWGGLERAVGFALGSFIGLITGGTVGAVIRTEAWSDVSPVHSDESPVAAR